MHGDKGVPCTCWLQNRKESSNVHLILEQHPHNLPVKYDEHGYPCLYVDITVIYLHMSIAIQKCEWKNSLSASTFTGWSAALNASESFESKAPWGRISFQVGPHFDRVIPFQFEALGTGCYTEPLCPKTYTFLIVSSNSYLERTWQARMKSIHLGWWCSQRIIHNFKCMNILKLFSGNITDTSNHH